MTRSHSNSKNVTFLRIANTRRKSQVVACARRHDLMIHVMRWFFYLNNCFYTPGRYFYTCSLVGSFPVLFLIPQQRLLSVSLSFSSRLRLRRAQTKTLSLSLSIISRAVYHETTATKIITFQLSTSSSYFPSSRLPRSLLSLVVPVALVSSSWRLPTEARTFPRDRTEKRVPRTGNNTKSSA